MPTSTRLAWSKSKFVPAQPDITARSNSIAKMRINKSLYGRWFTAFYHAALNWLEISLKQLSIPDEEYSRLDVCVFGLNGLRRVLGVVRNHIQAIFTEPLKTLDV